MTHKKPTSKNRSHTREERKTRTAYATQQKIAHVGLSAPHDGAQLKTPHPPLPFFSFFFLAMQGAQGRESLFTGAGRRDDDTSMVLSTAVTSPEAEDNGAKNDATLFRPRARKPTGPPAPSRPTLPVIDATKIIEDYRTFFASFWPGIFRIPAKNLPLLSLRPSLTVGMTKIPKIPGLFTIFFCWNLRNLPTEPTSEMRLRLSLETPLSGARSAK